MLSSLLVALLAGLASAAPAVPGTAISKRAPSFDLYPPPGLSVLTNAFKAASPLQPNSGANFWGTSIPEDCRNKAIEQGVDPHQMQVFDVTYNDCSKNWIFCRAPGAVGPTTMLNEFGRLPVKLRGRVRYLMAFPGSDSASTNNDNIVLFGNTATITVLHHEAAHSLDSTFGGQLHASSSYVSAKNADSCWPDDYASSSDAENWAQVLVVHRFQVKTGTQGPHNTACMQNQLSAIAAQTNSYLSATTCDLSQRVPNTRILHAGEW